MHGLQPGHVSKRRGGWRGAVPAVMAVTGRRGTGPGGCITPHAHHTWAHGPWNDGGQETAAARDTGSGLPVQWRPFWLAGKL